MGLIWVAVIVATLVMPAHGRSPAVVVQINGSPAVERNGAVQLLQPGAPVEQGDTVTTGAESKIRIVLADDSVLTIGPNSRVAVDTFVLAPEGRSSRLRALAGSFKLAISKLLAGDTHYEIRTPTAVIGVRGTVVWGDIGLDSVCALDGHVEVTPVVGNATAALDAGECVQQMGGGEPLRVTPSPAELQKYLQAVTLD